MDKKSVCAWFLVAAVIVFLGTVINIGFEGRKPKIASEKAEITCFTSDNVQVDVQVWTTYIDDKEDNEAILRQSIVSNARTIISKYSFKDLTIDHVAAVERLLTENIQLDNPKMKINRVTIREIQEVKRYLNETQVYR